VKQFRLVRGIGFQPVENTGKTTGWKPIPRFTHSLSANNDYLAPFNHVRRFREIINTMTTRHASLLAIIVVASFLWPAASGAIEKPPSVEVDGNIKWVYDYDEAKLLSQASGKPMFVVFRCER